MNGEDAWLSWIDSWLNCCAKFWILNIAWLRSGTDDWSIVCGGCVFGRDVCGFSGCHCGVWNGRCGRGFCARCCFFFLLLISWVVGAACEYWWIIYDTVCASSGYISRFCACTSVVIRTLHAFRCRCAMMLTVSKLLTIFALSSFCFVMQWFYPYF